MNAPQTLDERSAALAGSMSKDRLAQECRAAGWSGDDARTPKMILARWLAEHQSGMAHTETEAEQGFVPQFPTEQAEQATATQAAPEAAAKPRTVKEEPKQDRAAANAALLASAVAAAMSGVKLGVDTEEIQAAVRAEMGPLADQIRAELIAQVYRIEVKRPNGETVDVGRQHKQFEQLLTMVSAGVHVWLAGPAGSGKTTAAQATAKALGLPFYFNGAIDTEYKLSGFVDANGHIVSTAFREAYTNGGVYLFDECDASMPSATLAFNAALANGHADFPGSTEATPRHENFRCIAAANTWGTGATSDYIGRNKLDAAFLDRFVFLSWEYDELLEREICGNPDWCSVVQTMRTKAKGKGLKIVISPRASILGAKLLAAGMKKRDVIQATIAAKLTAEQWKNLES